MLTGATWTRGWAHKRSQQSRGPMPAMGLYRDLATLPAALQRSLLRALLKLDEYLSTPLEHELAQDPCLRASQRRFLDGDHLTLADCNLLPKLNIVQVSYGHPSTMPFSFLWHSHTLTFLLVATASACSFPSFSLSSVLPSIPLPRNPAQDSALLQIPLLSASSPECQPSTVQCQGCLWLPATLPSWCLPWW